MNPKPEISVIVATYNQENYIGRTLGSIVMQECDFNIEVLVGDDASLDKTGSIVLEYAANYPNLILPFRRKKNLGAYKNTLDLVTRAQGEFIAFLEGDDFWLDRRKLQKQRDFLKRNPEFCATFGRVIVVDEQGNRRREVEEYLSFFKGREFTVNDFNAYLLPGQTATALYRRKDLTRLISMQVENPKLRPRLIPVIDRFLVLEIMSLGRIKVSEDVLAAYRYINKEGGTSWSSKHDGYSLGNIVYYLYGMHELERIGKQLGLPVDFDDRRRYEIKKAKGLKKELPFVKYCLIRFFIWLWYKKKKPLLVGKNKENL
ncbi:MAG: glycosyltransferase [Coriobacteriales bacterium]|nr:glycosyltransferase [Coriobacteriales bacterium]